MTEEASRPPEEEVLAAETATEEQGSKGLLTERPPTAQELLRARVKQCEHDVAEIMERWGCGFRVKVRAVDVENEIQTRTSITIVPLQHSEG